MLKDIFNKTTNSIIISNIVLCLIGLIVSINPNFSISTVGIITSIYLIAHGLFLIIVDLKVSEFYIPFDGIIPGILSIVLGILLLIKPDLLATILTISMGIWICLSSISIIKLSLAIKSNDSFWLLLFILGIIDLIVGCLVIINPFDVSISIVVFIGIMVIIHSILNIIDMLIIKRDVKKITKVLENKISSFNLD